MRRRQPATRRPLARVQPRLHRGFRPADGQFVELARALRHLYTSAQTLTELANQRVGAVHDALTDSRLSAPRDDSAVLARMQSAFAEASEEHNTLHTMAAELHRLHSPLASIQRIGVFFRAFGLGFAIESARRPRAAQLRFLR